MSDRKIYRVIAASDSALVDSLVPFEFVQKARSTGWGYTYVKDRNVHLLHRATHNGNAFIEVSEHTLQQTFLLVESGN